jgi:hypothetical protein
MASLPTRFSVGVVSLSLWVKTITARQWVLVLVLPSVLPLRPWRLLLPPEPLASYKRGSLVWNVCRWLEYTLYEVWDSHGNQEVTHGLQGCDVWYRRWSPLFWRNILPPFSYTLGNWAFVTVYMRHWQNIYQLNFIAACFGWENSHLQAFLNICSYHTYVIN